VTRYAFYALVVVGVVWLLVAARTVSGDPAPTTADVPVPAPPPVVSVPADPASDLELAALRRRFWVEHRRRLRLEHRVHTLTRTLAHHSSTREAIDLACAVYGSCQTLWSLARCESQLRPTARNASSASGLFQFLPSTFASTPFGRFSIFSPYSQALAAGWMLTHGRRGEWVC
jgi:Transglycosylase SLT domain